MGEGQHTSMIAKASRGQEGKRREGVPAGFAVVFEDSEIVIVNKNAGLATQGGAGVVHSLDVELSRYLGHKAHLVHRLDKDTAGLIVVAKDSRAAAKWSAVLSQGQVKKEYIAVCFGYPVVRGMRRQSGTLESQVASRARLLAATTHFQVEKTATLSVPSTDDAVDLCVIRAVLGTGRTHQIRLQLAQALCPVVADDKHGDFAQNRLVRKLKIKRLQLAAVRLDLPLEGKVRTFTVPLPPHIQSTLSLFNAR